MILTYQRGDAVERGRAAGADIVQVDEPYMQARPQKADDYGLAALNRALDDITGTTAVHICFGYAAIIHERPSGYSLLTQLKNCSCRQVSIETAQSKLDCSVLSQLGGKKILEEKSGPQARELFEKFIRDFEKLQAEQEQRTVRSRGIARRFQIAGCGSEIRAS
jgi:hypothetical protein